MTKVVQIEKADPTYKGHQIEDVEIRIHKTICFDDEPDPMAIFQNDAEELFDALRSLPGGTFDQLLILMLQKAASSFIVPHNFHDEEKPKPSMLALLEKALPIIEREADARCDAMQQNGLTTDDSAYWVEMIELKREISAEIDKIYGREGKSNG